MKLSSLATPENELLILSAFFAKGCDSIAHEPYKTHECKRTEAILQSRVACRSEEMKMRQRRSVS